MSSKDWERFGEEIRQTVQNAVENGNYEKLNQVISDTVNQAADAVAKGIKTVADSSYTKYRGYKTYTTDSERAKRTASEPLKTSGMQYSNVSRHASARPSNTLIKAPSKIMALVIAGIGYTIGIVLLGGMYMFGIALVIASGAGNGWIFLAVILMLILGVPAFFAFRAGIGGTRKFLRLERLENYLKVIGQREYCNISELTESVGKPPKAVINDLEYMIKKHWFLQGHLDKQKTCLMISDQMYQQYCQLEQRKEAEAKEIEMQKNAQEKLSPEIQKIISQGDEYLKKIRACNDAIPGEEISAKIYRIEMLTDKIFDRVEQEPKAVSDIQKLMDYYLPTTVKLLEAYVQMDAQPVGGENIRTAKKEIEATLDTLNIAFEKLLDGLFQETAWDVSSDISVLNTMLAREGLKEDGLKANK